MLDHIDACIGSGVLDAEELNAADYMIAPSLALVSYVGEVGAELDGRPALGLLDRILPDPARPADRPVAA